MKKGRRTGLAKSIMPLVLVSTILVFGIFLTRTLIAGPPACLPLYQKKIIDPVGLTFDVTETDCDVIAKEFYAEIYVSRTGDDAKTLIFKYDPEQSSHPTVRVFNRSTIMISISSVSSVIYQANEWQNMIIRYRIGKIQYPSPLPRNIVRQKPDRI